MIFGADVEIMLATTASSTTTPPTSHPPAIAMSGVERRFGDVKAVHGLDMCVPTGSITGLLGPNGAGKTTAIRLITGALEPTAGEVRVFGLDPTAHGIEVRSRCGIVSAKPALYDRLSGWANLRYAADLYGLAGNTDERVHHAASRFGIEHALDQQVGAYSTGMKTRLALSRSVLHEPELLLLDEPTSGLDPESSLAVLELIADMARIGTTIVLCTHLLLEAEGVADQLIVIEDGTDLATGSQQELTRAHWPHPALLVNSQDPSAAERLATAPGVIGMERQKGTLIALLDRPDRTPEIVNTLVASGIPIDRIEPWQASLEALYFAMRDLDTSLLRHPVPSRTPNLMAAPGVVGPSNLMPADSLAPRTQPMNRSDESAAAGVGVATNDPFAPGAASGSTVPTSAIAASTGTAPTDPASTNTASTDGAFTKAASTDAASTDTASTGTASTDGAFANTAPTNTASLNSTSGLSASMAPGYPSPSDPSMPATPVGADETVTTAPAPAPELHEERS